MTARTDCSWEPPSRSSLFSHSFVCLRRKLGEMGRLAFGSETVTFDDRLLGHLEVVMVAKLRRREPFILTWTVDPSLGSGRVSRWVGVSTSWDIRYHSRAIGPINPAWIDA